MVGPIVFVIIEAGIEKGFFASLIVTLGIWLSDLLFILVTYNFIAKLIDFQESDQMKFWLGLIGGLILIIVGIGSILKTSTKKEAVLPKPFKYPKLSSSLNYFIKGFLVNTINPFTIFFWISVMAGLSTKNELGTTNGFLLIFGIISTVILTDVLKAYFAGFLKKRLNLTLINRIRNIAGTALILFGVALIVQIFL